MFIKTFFKDSKKVKKKIEIMYQNAIYICICDEKLLISAKLKRGVTRDSYILLRKEAFLHSSLLSVSSRGKAHPK